MILGASEAGSYCRCLGLSFAGQASFEQPFIQPTPRHESQQQSLRDVWKPRVSPSGASPGPVRAWTALLAWNIMAVANMSRTTCRTGAADTSGAADRTECKLASFSLSPYVM